MKLVKEIMVPVNDYSTIHQDATIKEAVAALRASFHREDGALHGHQSLIVLDGEEKLVGLLTLRSLLTAIGIKALVQDVWMKAETWSWYFLNRLQEQARVRVKDIMRPIELFTVEANKSVFDAALLFSARHINSLPVTEQGKVIGILRTIDVFRFLKNVI